MTIRENRRGFLKTKENTIARNAKRGTIRYIRDSELLFVKWKDTIGKSQFCNQATGAFERVDVPIHPAVKDYNQSMGCVDLSDQLVHYYIVLHKTNKWYKTPLYQFVDIAVVNSYIMHNEMNSTLGLPALTQNNCQLVYDLVGDNLMPRPDDRPPYCSFP